MEDEKVVVDRWLLEERFSKLTRQKELLERLAAIGSAFFSAENDVQKQKPAEDDLQEKIRAIKQKLVEDALQEIWAFLVDQRASTAAQNMILNLQGEIENISQGREVVFLQPPKIDRRRAKSRHKQTYEAYVVAAVDHMIRVGKPNTEAAEIVLSYIRKFKLPMPGSRSRSNRSDSERLLTLREEFQRKHFDLDIKELRDKLVADVANDEPEAGVKRLLRHMAKTFGSRSVWSSML